MFQSNDGKDLSANKSIPAKLLELRQELQRGIPDQTSILSFCPLFPKP